MRELVLYFYRVVSVNLNQHDSLGSKCVYPMSHFSGLPFSDYHLEGDLAIVKNISLQKKNANDKNFKKKTIWNSLLLLCPVHQGFPDAETLFSLPSLFWL